VFVGKSDEVWFRRGWKINGRGWKVGGIKGSAVGQGKVGEESKTLAFRGRHQCGHKIVWRQSQGTRTKN